VAEIWKPVVGWKGFYEVSNLGRVRSLAHTIMRSNGRRQTFRSRILRPCVLHDRGGYLAVSLSRSGKGHTKPVHVLVARAFHGPCPKGQQIRHRDGVTKNCRSTNIRYGTPTQNSEDRLQHGTFLRGERCPSTKLTQKQVIEIRNRAESSSSIAHIYGVSPSTIRNIRHGATWRWL